MNKSTMRTKYMTKFLIRCAVLLIVLLLYFIDYKGFSVMEEWNFFKEFSLFHLLWAVWLYDMIQQLIPARGVVSLGSQKLFLMHFKPSNLKKTTEEIAGFIRYSHYANIKVGLVWLVLVGVICSLRVHGILNCSHLLIIMVLFYVADLICVLFWCPFRVFFMKNRCCATCTIFNWDHIMMFSPGVFCMGFFSWSLFALAAVVFVIWEVNLFMHPERFWEETNEALKCSNCEEFLCGKNMHAKGLSNPLEDFVADKVETGAEQVKNMADEILDEINKRK